jgi:hypothetical protein
MTTERLMMRLKLAPMGLDPRIHLLASKMAGLPGQARQ